MSLKNIKPTTSSQRQLVLVDYSDLSKQKPLKKLVKGKVRQGGRNNHGRLTSFKKGGGHKQRYRQIDFKRREVLCGVVSQIEYDPNRTAFIALVNDKEKNKFSYILAPENLKVNDIVEVGKQVPIKPGNALPLESIPVGTEIHNIELKPGHGGQYARAAGTFGTLIQKDKKYAQVRLSSSEVRLVPIKCKATIGKVSNLDNHNTVKAKAGRSRWLGIRPTVRGVAMNPVDHPHGGGEGKTSGGRPSVSPWGKLTKGPRTRSTKRKNSLILQTRRQS